MSEQQPDYTLLVSTPDEWGNVYIHSPDVPGLHIIGDPSKALAAVPASVKVLRELNGAKQ